MFLIQSLAVYNQRAWKYERFKIPLVWAVALSGGGTRLTGPISVRGSIHGAHARGQCAWISPIVTAGSAGHIQGYYHETIKLVDA